MASDLLLTLHSASEIMRQTRLSEDAVLETAMQQLARFNLRGGILYLDETGAQLTVRTASAPRPVLEKLENLAGIRTIGYTIPVTRVDAYRRALEGCQTVFLPDSAALLVQLAPDSVRGLVGTIARLLDSTTGFIAPLIVDNTRLGLVACYGANLTPQDEIPLTALANHLAITILNARLHTAEHARVRQLDALNQIAFALNNSLHLEDALDAVLKQTLATLELPAGWIALNEGGTFRLAAHHNLPPALAAENYAVMRRQPCCCQRDLLAHKLPDAVNMLNCERLLEWSDGDTRGLTLHAAVPIRTEGHLFGMLNLAAPPSGSHFDQDDLSLLTLVGQQLAVAIMRTRLYAETQTQLAREQRLNEVARAITSSLDQATVLQTVMRLAAELTSADSATFSLVTTDGDDLLDSYYYNLPEPLNQPSPKGKGLMWRSLETKRAFRVDEYGAHPDALPNWVAAGVRSCMCVPLFIGEDVIGALCLFNFTPAKRFSERALALTESVARQAGIAIQTARLFEETRQRAAHQAALYAIIRTATRASTGALQNLLAEALELILRALNAEMGGIWISSPSKRIPDFGPRSTPQHGGKNSRLCHAA